MLELDSATRIAQSPAILWYLAEGTPFLPDDARRARARAPVARVRAGAGDGRDRRAALPAAHRSPADRGPAGGRRGRARAARRPPARPRLARRRRAARSPTSRCSATRTSRAEAGLEPGPHVLAWMERIRGAPRLRRRSRAVRRQRPAGRRPVDLRLTSGSPACPPEETISTPAGAPPAPGCATPPGGRARGRTSARWGSTRRGSTGPIVGIASTWTGTMPCNLNQRELSDAAAAAVDAAGGVALPFNTIAVSDNQSQGTPGMRASLISREVIADSIELMCLAHDFDALVCIVGCDKTTPAALMALARARQARGAALQRPAARRAPGRSRADDPRRLGGGRRARARADRPRRARRDRARVAAPGAGTCAGPVHGEHDGDGDRLPRAGRARRRADPAPRTARRRPRRRRARASGPSRSPDHGPTARAFLDRRGAAQRDGRRRGQRRLDQRGAAPAGGRARGRRRARRRTS